MAVAPVAWFVAATVSQVPVPAPPMTTVRVTVVDVAELSPANRPPAIATTAAAADR